MTDPHIQTRIQLGAHGALIHAWLPAPLHDIALEMLGELEDDLHAGDPARLRETLLLLQGLLDDARVLLVTPATAGELSHARALRA